MIAHLLFSPLLLLIGSPYGPSQESDEPSQQCFDLMEMVDYGGCIGGYHSGCGGTCCRVKQWPVVYHEVIPGEYEISFLAMKQPFTERFGCQRTDVLDEYELDFKFVAFRWKRTTTREECKRSSHGNEGPKFPVYSRGPKCEGFSSSK